VAEIAVVSESAGLRHQLRSALSTDNHQLAFVAPSTRLADDLAIYGADLVIYDCESPLGFRKEVFQCLRRTVRVPLIVLGPEYDERFVVSVLGGGADACMCKPFGAQELLARVEACLRRFRTWQSEAPRDVRRPSMDHLSHSVTITGREIKLTVPEYRLLSYLVEDPGRVIPRCLLCQRIWGLGEDAVATSSLYLCVHNLRRKLEADPSHPVRVLTRWGVGYFWGAGRQDA